MSGSLIDFQASAQTFRRQNDAYICDMYRHSSPVLDQPFVVIYFMRDLYQILKNSQNRPDALLMHEYDFKQLDVAKGDYIRFQRTGSILRFRREWGLSVMERGEKIRAVEKMGLASVTYLNTPSVSLSNRPKTP